MGSPASIEIDHLLAPVSDANAVGEDLRRDDSPASPYYLLKDARKAARAKERTAAVEDGQVPDARNEWHPVLVQATALIAERSKDLELVAWLIEALARIKGFAGLRDGFNLTRELIDRYWDSCYPGLDEEGVEARTAPLAGLNGQDAEGTLIVPIRNIAITQGQSLGPFASWHLKQAVALQQVADPAAREKRIQAGAVTLERIDKAAAETEPSFFKNCLEDLLACQEAYSGLTARLDELCGKDNAPPTSNISNELKGCLEALQYVGKKAFAANPDGQSGDPEVLPASADSEEGKQLPIGAPEDREQALLTLQQLADFFRRTEPHSPLSYAIEQVVHWGRLPLPELLDEIIAEDAARQNLYRLTGIKRRETQG